MKELEALGPHFGSLVHGVDLATATDEQIAETRAALIDRKVLFFRDQTLDDDGQVDLGVMHRITMRDIPAGPR